METAKKVTRYLTLDDLCNRFQVSTRTIYNWMEDLNFPTSMKFTSVCVRWSLTEVEEWETQRIELQRLASESNSCDDSNPSKSKSAHI